MGYISCIVRAILKYLSIRVVKYARNRAVLTCRVLIHVPIKPAGSWSCVGDSQQSSSNGPKQFPPFSCSEETTLIQIRSFHNIKYSYDEAHTWTMWVWVQNLRRLQCKQLALKVQICSFSDKYCICNTCDCGSCLFLQPLYTIRDMIEVDKDAKHLKKLPISAIYYSSTRLIPEVSDNKQECISFRLLQLKHLRCWQNLYLNLRLRKTRGLEMYYL